MNAPFAAQFDADIGGAAFQLEGYTFSGDPVLDAEGTRYGTKLTYQLDGTLWATDAEDLPVVLDAFEASCETDGADLTITGSGETLEFLDASECIDGPTVKFGYGGDRGDNYQSVTVTVEAVRAVDPDADGILSAITEAARHQVNLESFETITYRGEVRTTGTPAASLVVLTGFGGIGPMIPVRPAGWQRTYSYEPNDADTECRWEATVTELAEAFPLDATMVDGERTISTEYDEHNRQITRYAYTYAGPGAEAWMDARHALLRQAGGLRRASISVTAHKTVSVSGTFEVLAGRDGKGDQVNLLSLVETISHARSGPLLREARYPGTTPLIVQDAQPGYVYQQAGRAVGLAVFPQAPAMKFAAANLVDKEIVPTRTSDVEYEVAWRYTFLFATIQNVALPSQRTDSTGVYAGGEAW